MSHHKTSTQVLLEDLLAFGAPEEMVSKCMAGQYNDYESDAICPISELIKDAYNHSLMEVMENAKAGKYDGTKEESQVWMEREGYKLLEGE